MFSKPLLSALNARQRRRIIFKFIAHLKWFVSWKVSSRGHVHINTEYQNVSKSLVRGWSWHRLRRITGQLVFYYGQITASLIHPPATGHCQLRGWLFGIHKTTQLLFVYQHQKSKITTTDKSLYYIYFWTLHVKMLCNLSHLYCCTACWDGLLKVPLSTIHMLRQHLGPGHTGSPEVSCPFLVMSPEPEMMVSIIVSTVHWC